MRYAVVLEYSLARPGPWRSSDKEAVMKRLTWGDFRLALLQSLDFPRSRR